MKFISKIKWKMQNNQLLKRGKPFRENCLYEFLIFFLEVHSTALYMHNKILFGSISYQSNGRDTNKTHSCTADA